MSDPRYAVLVGALPVARFEEIYGKISRKARNLLENRLLSHPGRTSSFTLRRKAPDTPGKIRDAIVQGEKDDLAGELLKAWLLERRGMLALALDEVGILHDNGLTDKELDPLEALPAERLAPLVQRMIDAGYPADEVAVYLAFVQVRAALEVDAVREVFERWNALDAVRDGYFAQLGPLADTDAEPRADGPAGG